MKGIVLTMLQRLLQGPDTLSDKTYLLSEIASHCHCNDCWIVICDHVYDITSFIDQHPGGMDILMEHAGRDATVAFYTSGHPPNTIDLLTPFCMGTLAVHERVNLIGSLAPNGSVRSMWSSDHAKVALTD